QIADFNSEYLPTVCLLFVCVFFPAVCKQGCHQSHGFCSEPGECKCHYGWTGPLCDQCVTFPGCVYGSCAEPWKCVCDVNWGGLLCDKVEHACLSSPCMNGATCDLVSGSRCMCPPGFSGTYCQNTRSPCDSAPCLHGGQCVETDGRTISCICPTGYSGNLCEQALDMCNPNPCQQGATCHSTEGRYVCVCPDGYYSNECISLKTPCTGQHCSGAVSDTKHGPVSFYIILVGVLALVTVCGCAACAFILSHLHRKRKKQQAVPQEEGINNQREFVNLIRNVDRPAPLLPNAPGNEHWLPVTTLVKRKCRK
uniref:EGF-like domain-containing protein n=1 Tax=Takifugu rubripes TaxID=31033 RepID=A0A674P6N4_TAKRU